MSMKGGSLKPPEIKMFLQASYEEKAPKQLDDYTLDEKLSNLYGKVYVNHKMKKVVVAHRGTVENIDWANNALYALSSEAYNALFAQSIVSTVPLWTTTTFFNLWLT